MPIRWLPDRALWCVILVALAVRLPLFLLAAPRPARFMVDSDATEYERLGQNLAAGHGFSQADRAPYTPDVRRTPVYPVAIAPLLALGGGRVGAAVLAGVIAPVATVL